MRITRLFQHSYRIGLAGVCDMLLFFLAKILYNKRIFDMQQKLVCHYNRLFGKYGTWIEYSEYEYWWWFFWKRVQNEIKKVKQTRLQLNIRNGKMIMQILKNMKKR